MDVQRRIAADLQRQAFETVPCIPLGQYLQSTAYRTSLRDVLDGFSVFWNLRKEG